jgi:hypothetical protein
MTASGFRLAGVPPLLEALEAPGAPAGLKDLPAIEVLRRVWQRHFECTPDGKPPAGGVRLRADRELARAAEALEDKGLPPNETATPTSSPASIRRTAAPVRYGPSAPARPSIRANSS